MKQIHWKVDLFRALIVLGVITLIEFLLLRESFDFVEDFLPILGTILAIYLIRLVVFSLRR